MADFDLEELARRSGAATQSASWIEPRVLRDRDCDGSTEGFSAAGPEHDVSEWRNHEHAHTAAEERATRDAELIAYFGTHRETIIAELTTLRIEATAGRKLRDRAAMKGPWMPLVDVIVEYDVAVGGKKES